MGENYLFVLIKSKRTIGVKIIQALALHKFHVAFSLKTGQYQLEPTGAYLSKTNRAQNPGTLKALYAK
jgi:hypothetical protein